MPPSNFEERVQERLANSLKLRHYSMTLSALLLVLGIVFALAGGESRTYIAILWFLILFASSIPSVVSLKRRRSVVLWIRRFHRGAQSRMEQQFLEGAVNPWGRLVTLADSNIRSASGSRSAIWLVAIMGGGSALAAALGLLNWVSVYFLLGFGGFLAWNWTRKGTAGLKPDDWTKKLVILNKSRSVVAAGLSGVVLNCPPDTDLWRDVIQSLAAVVNAAVISVPENTPQLEWELTTLRTSLGPGKIIVLTSGDIALPVAMEPLQVIQVPKSVSWWHDYRVSYFGAAWRSAMTTVLRAIESVRPGPQGDR
jgi:hypothetical protein